MALAASMLRSEMRRHLLMNFSLVASCVVGATVVTNERGLFVPIEFRMSDTARAFSAMFTQSHLLPEPSTLSDVRMVSPLDAFEVTADSRDLRRRLMENFSNFGGPENNFGDDNKAEPTNQLQQSFTRVENTPLQIAEGGTGSNVASNAITSGNGSGTGSGSNNSSSSGTNQTTTGNTSSPVTSGSNNSSSTTSVPTNQATTTSSTSAPVNPNSTTLTSTTPTTPVDTVGAVPEPSSWAMMIAGFGFVGYFLRTARRRKLALQVDAEA